jgi:hypothetical protein
VRKKIDSRYFLSCRSQTVFISPQVIDKTMLGAELSVRLMRVPKIETILRDLESKGLSVGLGKRSPDQPSEYSREGQSSGRCSMIARLFDAVFGCRHSRYSFPVTIRGKSRRPQAAALTGTYVACLDCGREFPYDWQEMRVITSSAETRQYTTALATKQAA